MLLDIARNLNRATERGGQGIDSRSTTQLTTTREQGQARGLSAPTGRLWVGSVRGRRGLRPCTIGEPRIGKRNASALRGRMWCEYNVRNCEYISVKL
eukprot:1441920-Pleurochrysis_carterae.AAC.1